MPLTVNLYAAPGNSSLVLTDFTLLTNVVSASPRWVCSKLQDSWSNVSGHQISLFCSQCLLLFPDHPDHLLKWNVHEYTHSTYYVIGIHQQKCKFDFQQSAGSFYGVHKQTAYNLETVISLLLLLLEKRGLLPLGAMQRMAPISKFAEYVSLLCASTTLLLVMAALFRMGPLSLIITTPPTDVYMYSAAYCIYMWNKYAHTVHVWMYIELD